MPNRTIYIADADIPIFEKAQQLAGDNLSSTIAHALRRFVETEEAKASGFEEITVKVGKGRPLLQKQFRGRLLARRRVRIQNGSRWLVLTVYQTARGRFALHTKSTPNWSGWSNKSNWSSRSRWATMSDEDWANFDWASYYEDDEQRLEVYETLDDLKDQVPEDLYETIAQVLSGDDVEILDI